MYISNSLGDQLGYQRLIQRTLLFDRYVQSLEDVLQQRQKIRSKVCCNRGFFKIRMKQKLVRPQEINEGASVFVQRAEGLGT